jgi:hypothetical protein
MFNVPLWHPFSNESIYYAFQDILGMESLDKLFFILSVYTQGMHEAVIMFPLFNLVFPTEDGP